MHRLPRYLLAAAFLLGLLGAAAARAEVQTVPLNGTGWRFISFQVQPAADDPAIVFGVGYYDHVWTYDPLYGWFHFSPLPELSEFNDLDRVEALRGYWIHLTAPHPDGGVTVNGDRPAIFEIVDPGWHAVGVFSGSGTLAQAYAPLDDLTLAAAVAEVWSYEGDAGGFRQIFESGGPVPACPGADCLQEGRGYWLLANEGLLVGQEITSSTECITLAPGATTADINVAYRGLDAGMATLRTANVCVENGDAHSCKGALERCCALRPDAPCTSDAQCAGQAPPLTLLPPRMETVAGQEIPQPDTSGARPDGPDDCAQGACGGDPGCASICFANASSGTPTALEPSGYKLYATLPQATFLSLGAAGAFSTCDEPYTTLVLEQRPAAVGGATTAGASAPPTVRKVIKVAVQPPVIDGAYAGRLVYGTRPGAVGGVPIHLVVDGCTLPPGGTRDDADCGTGRVTAIINPRIKASTSNGLDDDGDGSVDEKDENGAVIPQRKALSFPRELVLHGSLSADHRFVRFGGSGLLPGLQFADNTPDAGIAKMFVGASRELSFEGSRAGLSSFRGVFSEVYSGAEGDLTADGVFELSRVESPQCIVRDAPTDDSTQTVRLGQLCQTDDDCPRRCMYPQLTSQPSSGIPCAGAADCPTICLDDRGRVVDCSRSVPGQKGPYAGATCEPYQCGFLSPAPGTASGRAIEHGSGTVSVAVDTPPGTQSNRSGVVELSRNGLPVRRLVKVNGATPAQIAFDDLPCGVYDVRLSFEGCDEDVTRTICWCGLSCSVSDDCPGGWTCSAQKQCIPPDGLCVASGNDIDLMVEEADCPTKYCEFSRKICRDDVECEPGRCLSGIPSHPTAGGTRMASQNPSVSIAVTGGFHAAAADHCLVRDATTLPTPAPGATPAPTPDTRPCRFDCGTCGSGPAAPALLAPARLAERILCTTSGDCPASTICAAKLPPNDQTPRYCSTCGNCSDVVRAEVLGVAGAHIVGGLSAAVELTAVVTDVDQTDLLRTGLVPVLADQ